MAGIGHWARVAPDATALAEGSRALSYAELDDRQRRLVTVLRAEGVNKAERIAVLAKNSSSHLEVTTGALRAGIVPVPINPLLTSSEVAYLVEDSGARWLFTDRPFQHPKLERVVTFGDAYERLLHDATPTDLADVTLGRPMHYTSGTTGFPKGVWVEPPEVRRAHAISERFRRMWGLDADEVHLVCSPLAHSAPHRFSTRTLEAGGMVIVQPKFDAETTLASIELFSATSSFMVPTHLERIVGLGYQTLSRHDLSSLRLLVHAGAPIREATKRAAVDLFPRGSVWEFYGATEGQATRISTDEWIARPGSVGRPHEGARIQIRSEDGEELSAVEVGEVWIQDPGTERFEYWGDKAKTRSAWSDGYFTVGDLGYLDEAGYLFLTGRKHDTIISGGVNVYPQEVERVLAEHPAVREAVVYGRPHAEWGQQVVAAVVPAFGQPLDPDALRNWARERLAGFKCPKVIEVYDELPRGPTGKIKRPPFD